MATHRTVIVDGTLERDIITAMITSTAFLSRVAPMADPKLFAVEVTRKVARWVLDYYGKYSRAPGRGVQALFEEGKPAMGEAEAKWVAEFLASLSKEYEDEGEEAFNKSNEAYLLDRATRHFKRQKVATSAKKILKLLERDKVEEAEEALKTISSEAPLPLSGKGNP
jgi:hypothetical protein